MTDDNRIVPSGELNLGQGSLEEIVNVGHTPLEKPKQAAPVIDFGPKFTFVDRLIDFLKHSYSPEDMKEPEYGTLERELKDKLPGARDMIGDAYFEKIVRVLGPIGLQLDSFSYHNAVTKNRIISKHDTTPIIVGRLGFGAKVNGAEFENLASAIMDEESFHHFKSTDVASEIGVGDNSKEVELGSSLVLDYLPDLRRISSLKGEYLLPNDPFIFLLGLNKESRRLVSAAYDIAIEKSDFPFLEGPKTYKTNATINDYITPKEDALNLVGKGLVGINTLLAAAKHHGIRELKPYLEDIASLRSKVEKAQ